MKGRLFESEFEEAVIQLFQQVGWQYTCGADLHRKPTESLLEADLFSYLQSRYADKQLSETDFQTIVANIRNVSGASDYLALYNTFSLYHDGYDLVRPN